MGKRYKSTGTVDIGFFNIPTPVANVLLEVLNDTITEAERPEVDIEITLHTEEVG